MKRRQTRTDLVLTINCGSSSIKYKLFSFPEEKVISKGIVEHIGEKGHNISDHHAGMEYVLDRLIEEGVDLKDITAVGHRVVHGGEEFIEPTVITSKVVKKIRSLFSLAPLHNPANLEGIIACQNILKGKLQVAVFDTAFHSTIPDYAFMYALPYEYYKKYGIRRYGFHGTSHRYVSIIASKRLGKAVSRTNLITCHLGNGCSITAVKGGCSVDTSMGFTPLEGLVMGTRCGDIDPALVLFLQEKEGLPPEEIDRVLNKKSGLIGISQLSNDFRELIQARAKGNKLAGLAIEVFKYRILKYVGAYAMVLGRVDAIVFTGGIGENVKEIHDYVGRQAKKVISGQPKIMVIPTDEELMIARHTIKLVKSRRGR